MPNPNRHHDGRRSESASAYVPLAEFLQQGTSVPALANSRRTLLRLKLIRHISRLQQADDETRSTDVVA